MTPSKTDGAAPTKARIRTCIACGKQSGKTDLLRIVRRADGSVSFDAKGRAPGRGAYVCSEACLAKACESHRLDRALKTKVSDSNYERIASDLQQALHDMQG